MTARAHPRRHMRWRREDDTLLVELVTRGATHEELARRFGRSEQAIVNRLRWMLRSGVHIRCDARRESADQRLMSAPWGAATRQGPAPFCDRSGRDW